MTNSSNTPEDDFEYPTVLTLARRQKFGYSLSVMESYGFQLVVGDNQSEHSEEHWAVFCNLNTLKFIMLKGNKFFGCRAEYITICELTEMVSVSESLGAFIMEHREIFEEAIK